jgi:penicillin amidase
VLVLLLAVAYFGLRASLPALDGAVVAGGLTHPATIERDALGIPTITGADRLDLAYATGYAHAQDRFFQMDLSRRLAAGELTPLFGSVAAAQDAKAQVFGFRKIARRVLEQASPAQRSIVRAYTQGVNAGLESLDSRPFEYWILRARPSRWQPEDTILVIYAMWWDLQYGGLRREQLRRQIDAKLGGPVLSSGWKRASCFLSPPRTGWDAPNESEPAPMAASALHPMAAASPVREEAAPKGGPVSGPGAGVAEPPDCASIPSPEELNVRGSPVRGATVGDSAAGSIGSNNWALAGARTVSGGALVASDMHLSLRVPAIWYRVRLRTSGLDLNGLTLPGAPVLVAGSNGSIAWSYSNSYGDWMHVEQRRCGSAGPGLRFDAPDERGMCWFGNWLASLPEATNLRLLDFESAHSIQDVLALAPEVGIPHQNLIVGDREGHIAWTIVGRMPAGTGTSRYDGAGGWLSASEQPRIVDPPRGQLFAANGLATDIASQEQRIGGDETMLGSDYDLGARARQIRDDLRDIPGKASAADMLAIQLDDRAVFLTHWHDFLVELLDESALRGHSERAELKRLVASWQGRAVSGSTGYRLVRDFRGRVQFAVWQMILHALSIESQDAAPPAHFERPLWTLVTQRPQHMLSSDYADWRSFLLAQVDGTIHHARECSSTGGISGCFEPVRIRHPLSRALPALSALLDMPDVALPGDHDMPRVQDGAFGASERFAVTPGREAEGYLQIAGGQSGHPLSPYYRAGFAEWAAGKPLPFLPGATEHRLVLNPR